MRHAGPPLPKAPRPCEARPGRQRGGWRARGNSMLLLILALFASGPLQENLIPRNEPPSDPSRQDPTGRTVSPITVTGKTDKGERVSIVIDMPSDDPTRGEFVSIWPAKAYRNGTRGRGPLP